jgi:CheY-like chemotaxis protein
MTKPMILVADDVPLNFFAIEDLLEQAGYQPVLAMNGKQAVETFLSMSCSLILMDLRMPVMNGLDAVRRIRQHEQSLSSTLVARIPIIMLSASLDDRRAAREAGCDDYLVKPLDRKLLSGVLAKHLHHMSHQVLDNQLQIL